MEIPDLSDRTRRDCDVLVIGGGTAGTMAALTAAEHGASVLLLDKAHVRHSGALAMGMDGVNNAVIPGKATPEDYVAEITRANDGIVNQKTVYQTATRGFAMIGRLERYGVKFEKDEYGEYAVRRVHRSGSYVLPMPEGKDVKKALYRVLRKREMRDRITIENRLMPVRVLTDDGRAVGAAALHTRTGEFVEIAAKTVILATGPCGRLGLPASGYLYGTYENPTNAGDGYSMAYHAGAELSGIECFQINPLIKDYNGPACAYVANPFGGYQVNAAGERFVDSDYWSGEMMAEVSNEIESARGPIYLKVSHLPEETLGALESILHTTERPTRGTFHRNRGHDYRTHDIEMHISEIGLCSGHSASGVWVDENGRTTVDGLYAAGDLACVPHNYMIGAFVYGELTGTHAAETARELPMPTDLPSDQLAAAHELIYRPLRNPDGPPQPQVEYKLRRFVNDYVAPPKTSNKLAIAIETFERMRADIEQMGARTPHELMRCAEVTFIRDCAEFAARSSLTRTESRWGLYHQRADLPDRRDDTWGYHLNLRKSADGTMEFVGRPVEPYLVGVEGLDHIPPTDRSVIAIEEPPIVSGPGYRGVDSPVRPPVSQPPATASPRIVQLLALSPAHAADLDTYLDDDDATVRRTAISVLGETTPEAFDTALVVALADGSTDVRAAAAHGLRELVEILEPTPELLGALRDHVGSADPVVRSTVVDLLRALRSGDRDLFTHALSDADHRVRIEAIGALVSLDAAAPIAEAVVDDNREVRIAVAEGLATIGAGGNGVGGNRVGGNGVGGGAIRVLASDRDPLVRAAALAAMAHLGDAEIDGPQLVAALRDSAWQVRVGAARGLAVARTESTVAALSGALDDVHHDVRRAAALTLSLWADDPDVQAILERAAEDSDADVRAAVRRSTVRASTVRASTAGV
ncbi:fumarate reductase/succinate dehydrogenase flavoprotein subunit [Gordonia polyisoprenivorans]|uniref:fumarate reductase/succinate dehydrogenase flavoprotein subunit n=1 Tax=Gordonia polyisoprenivorans TaxID=84595 RepID=UPI000B99E273|nr:fumarate reductase/succinate dehydrogenase flavoprotein subunit [Gordonia polyisoprenivorans]OZC29237.1 fumarate reductase/succinate dehydrogenase flavoprotein subunit [Gordonia polyisoprenivorans]